MSVLVTPTELRASLPVTQQSAAVIEQYRTELMRIIDQRDDRLVVIVGPCSIHNPDSALRYAQLLKTQIEKHRKTLCIIMRTYIEKARTSVGWKGLINDPDLNNTFEIEKGLFLARKLLLDINEMQVPVGTELLNPFTTAYFSDLISWSAIGARTTESQIHREIASHLSIPVGFKNNTNGDIQVAIDAVQTACQSHHYLGLDLSGKMAMLQSTGNPYAHVVLRGSNTQPNYDHDTIAQTTSALKQLTLPYRILIDCSHGNSQKDHTQQIKVAHNLAERISQGDDAIFGMMLESHLTSGKQAWMSHRPMHPDQSITDACIGWSDTEAVLNSLSEAVTARRALLI